LTLTHNIFKKLEIFLISKGFKVIDRNTSEIRGQGGVEELERATLRYGVLIAIEGIDGAGKTTQSKLLLGKLVKEGYSAVCFHEPTEGKWGLKIKDLAINGRHKTSPEEEMSFFYQDRVEDVEKNIYPALKDRKAVIMDRYYFSNVAYQSARGLNPDTIEERNERIAPKPNLLIILDLTPQAALKRIKEKRNGRPNHFERMKHLEKIREIFLKRFKERTYAKIIDGDDVRSESTIATEIWNIVKPIIKEAEAL
jgi:dTMP kinase